MFPFSDLSLTAPQAYNYDSFTDGSSELWFIPHSSPDLAWHLTVDFRGFAILDVVFNADALKRMHDESACDPLRAASKPLQVWGLWRNHIQMTGTDYPPQMAELAAVMGCLAPWDGTALDLLNESITCSCPKPITEIVNAS